ncbi:MAG: hypothetical protein ABJH28_02825 [Paraglaciecola sp.]|uniref:hypothetical protein n=1 Tax=Paraglaciecola sp. TaxID=1920173 RepID=UPI0032637821
MLLLKILSALLVPIQVVVLIVGGFLLMTQAGLIGGTEPTIASLLMLAGALCAVSYLMLLSYFISFFKKDENISSKILLFGSVLNIIIQIVLSSIFIKFEFYNNPMIVFTLFSPLLSAYWIGSDYQKPTQAKALSNGT